jgi:hypothetical protein
MSEPAAAGNMLKDPEAATPYPVAVRRKSLWFWPALALLVVVICLAGLFFASYVMYNQRSYYYRFDRSVKGWSPMGQPEGMVDIVPDMEAPEGGKGCLRYSYAAVKDQFSGVAMWVPNLKHMASIEMWVKSDESRDLVIGVEQEDGASFLCYVPVRQGVWTYAKAEPRFFILNLATPSRSLQLDVSRLMNKIFLADVSGLRGTTGPNRFHISALKVTRSLP